ncbi:MAG: copper chaperone PCu(A)C [Betaproteobacteria bacterium]|nr:copper chaperone PCu(A)C [Betaproteobacteria bacterium]
MRFRSMVMPALSAFAILLGSAAASQAQVTIKEPWVRSTVPGQSATGAFMQLTARQDTKLIAVRSPVAGIVEVHEMLVDKGIMKMRSVDKLLLPAGKTVELRSGGYHVMMMDLKRQIKTGDEIPLTIEFESSQGQRVTVDVKAVARLVKP